jgi:preprotein translocase subunit SecF
MLLMIALASLLLRETEVTLAAIGAVLTLLGRESNPPQSPG